MRSKAKIYGLSFGNANKKFNANFVYYFWGNNAEYV